MTENTTTGRVTTMAEICEESLHQRLADTVLWSADGPGWKVFVVDRERSDDRVTEYKCVAVVDSNTAAHALADGLVARGILRDDIDIVRANTTALHRERIDPEQKP